MAEEIIVRAKIYLQRGVDILQKGDVDGAIDCFTKAIGLKPDLPEAYFHRGVAWNDMINWNDMIKWDKAIADFDKAIELKPDYTLAYYWRGTIWNDKNEPDKAIADYDKAIELNPDFFDAYRDRGTAWEKKGEQNKAIADFDRAIKLKSNFNDLIHSRDVAQAHQNIEGIAETPEDNREKLGARVKEEKDKAFYSKWLFNSLLVVFAILCACFVTLILYKTFSLPESKKIYPPIAEAIAFGIISFPFIWGLRLLKTAQSKAEILAETFENLIFIEDRIIIFTNKDPEQRNKMYEKYISHRITDGPEKTLLNILQGKKDKPPITSPAQAVIELVTKDNKKPTP